MSDIHQMRATVAKALAHPTRMKIIDLLQNKSEVCVCDIVEELEEGQSTISKHLGVLKDAGLLESRKEGLMVFYNLKPQCIGTFFECLDKVLFNDIEQKHSLFAKEVKK